MLTYAQFYNPSLSVYCDWITRTLAYCTQLWFSDILDHVSSFFADGRRTYYCTQSSIILSVCCPSNALDKKWRQMAKFCDWAGPRRRLAWCRNDNRRVCCLEACAVKHLNTPARLRGVSSRLNCSSDTHVLEFRLLFRRPGKNGSPDMWLFKHRICYTAEIYFVQPIPNGLQ